MTLNPKKDYTAFRKDLSRTFVNTIAEQATRKIEAAARRKKFEKEKADPVKLLFNEEANPLRREREEAIRTLKTIWKNVKTEELRYRSIKIANAEKVLGQVCGAVETIPLYGFAVREEGKRLFMSLDTSMEPGEKVFNQVIELEKKHPPKKSRPWRGNWVVKNFLCLGGEEEAKNYDELKERGITHILNVADNVDCYFKRTNEFKYKQLKVKDFGKDRGIMRAFPDAINFILDAEKEKGAKVLIHCFAGQNRSVTCTVAFVMHSETISLLKAWRIVKHARPLASPFLDNRRQLIQYEKQTRGVNTMRITDFNVSYGGDQLDYNYRYRYGYGYGYGYSYGY